jgi:hypothetical protein
MLLWADSFSWLGTDAGTTINAQLANRYGAVLGSANLGVGEAGSVCLKGNSAITTPDLVPGSTRTDYVLGISFKVGPDTAANLNRTLVQLYETSTVRLNLFIVATPAQQRGDFKLLLNDAQGNLLGVPIGPFYFDEWHFLELKVFGTELTLRLGGYDALSVTLPAPLSIDRFLISIPNESVCDALYLLDSSGLTNNDFLGPVSVDGLFTLLEFNNEGWTPVGGSSTLALRWLDNDLRYLDGSLGGTVSFRMDPAFRSNAGAIAGLFISLVGKAGPITLRLNDNDVFAKSLGALYEFNHVVSESNPDTGAPWSHRDMAAVFFGLVNS